MKNKVISFSAFILLLPTVVFTQGAWTQKADFGGINRIGAVGFSIGNKGYIGLGYDYAMDSLKNDFWEYDPSTDVWTQKADLIGPSRSDATGFSIGTKGYIGLGADLTTSLGDLYEWEQSTNVWSKKSDLPGNSRMRPVSFSIGTKGYVGVGMLLGQPDIYLSDFWEWDQTSDTWSQKADFGGGYRAWAVCFSIGTKGYIGTGYDGSSLHKDLWEWDQSSDAWTQKADFGGGNRMWAIGFSIGNKGYIGTGGDGTYYNDFWEWDQGSNSWSQKINFSGTAREWAVGFSIGNKGFIGTGRSSLTAFNKDFWEWDPNGMVINETDLNNSVSVFPNPSNGVFAIKNKTFIFSAIDIYNANGVKVFESQENNTQAEIDLSSRPAGVYFVQVRTSEGDILKKVILQ